MDHVKPGKGTTLPHSYTSAPPLWRQCLYCEVTNPLMLTSSVAGASDCLSVSPHTGLPWTTHLLSASGGQHGEQEATSTSIGHSSTFLSLEVSSNSLASLAAELPEDKGPDYKATEQEDSREKRNRDFRRGPGRTKARFYYS